MISDLEMLTKLEIPSSDKPVLPRAPQCCIRESGISNKVQRCLGGSILGDGSGRDE